MIRLLSILGLGGLLAYAYSRAALPKFGGNAPPLTPRQAGGVYNQIRDLPAGGRPVPIAGLYNGRRLPEGYVGFGLHGSDAQDVVAALRGAGVNCLVSLSIGDETFRSAVQQAGIRHFVAPMGATFNSTHTTALAAARAACGPQRMAVHCEWGVDRTGSALAWLLNRYEGWSPQDAMWAQVSTSNIDVGPLANIFQRRNLPVPRTAPGSYAPMNIARQCVIPGACGHLVGGMKVRTPAYVGQAESTLAMMGA